VVEGIEMSIGYLWELGRWATKPDRYVVLSKTAKTFTVVMDREVSYRRERLVKSADVGTSWFASEREAWEHRVRLLRESVEHAKARLQDERTQLGMAESEVKRLSGEASGSDDPHGESEPGNEKENTDVDSGTGTQE
jgi:hypothetical protein